MFVPKPMWKGQDVYIIGGGPSLETFDFDQLKSVKTIGCNSAIELGEDIVDMCVFGDLVWYERYKDIVTDFKNWVITNNSSLGTRHIPDLLCMKREKQRMSKEGLTWVGCNTGAAAVNLACILGAKNVLLLGFDMRLDPDTSKPNWHAKAVHEANQMVYVRFLKGFEVVKKDIGIMFPGTSVYNLCPESHMSLFPKMSFEQWKEQSYGKAS